MIAGKRSCEAAARAASILMAGGGGFHRISVNHGPMMQNGLSKDYYGYNTRAPNAGDLVTVWIYGPIFAGYWLDPGRTAICGNRPTAAQKSLVEDCANYGRQDDAGSCPGHDARASSASVGRRSSGKGRTSTAGKPDSGNTGHGFGHGLATSFPGYVLPIGDVEIGPFGYRRLSETLKPGMVLASEAFLSRPGVGTAGVENNFIVTETGVELLDKSPMLYW